MTAIPGLHFTHYTSNMLPNLNLFSVSESKRFTPAVLEEYFWTLFHLQ